MEIQELDLLARPLDDTALLLLFTSFRPLRRTMLERFIHNAEPEVLLRHNRVNRDLLQAKPCIDSMTECSD